MYYKIIVMYSNSTNATVVRCLLPETIVGSPDDFSVLKLYNWKT